MRESWGKADLPQFAVREGNGHQRTAMFRTMRSRNHDVVLVGCTINLDYWEFGMGREWVGLRKGRSVYE
jgi:hypothetical protein